MKIDRFISDANGNVLAVVALTVAAIFGSIGLTMSDDSFDTAQWSAVSAANAVAVSPDGKDPTLDAGKDAVDPRATGSGFADESAQGTRPDAAH